MQLRLVAMAISRDSSFTVNEIDPEIAELLELLNASEQFDQIGKLFEQASGRWSKYSEEEQKWLVTKAASMMSKGRPDREFDAR